MAARRRYQSQNTVVKKLVRSVLAVFILSAFVLGISMVVKGVSTLDPIGLAKFSKPILAKLNISEDQAGEVAGEFVERISNTGINVPDEKEEDTGQISGGSSDYKSEGSSDSDDSNLSTSSKEVIYQIALMADSEDNFDNLELALDNAKQKGADKVMFLGDLTSYGEVGDLQEGQTVLNNSELEYYILPGDHDLAASDPAGDKNFKRVFDLTNQVVFLGDYKFMLFDNSKNFTPLSYEDMLWFEREVKSADFVLLSQPLYHPSINVVMGIVDGKEVEEVKDQAEELLNLIRGFEVTAIISADQHTFSVSDDPVKSDLTHYVVGSLLEAGSRNYEGPNYAILKIYDDNSFSVNQVDL